MTKEEFKQACGSICTHCKYGIAVRQREDTKEWVHDGAIAIAGTLGRRHSHSICLANDYRNENKGNISG